MNCTENRNPMSDLGCMTQRPNWTDRDFEPRIRPASDFRIDPYRKMQPLVRLRFWIALLAVVLWAVVR